MDRLQAYTADHLQLQHPCPLLEDHYLRQRQLQLQGVPLSPPWQPSYRARKLEPQPQETIWYVAEGACKCRLCSAKSVKNCMLVHMYVHAVDFLMQKLAAKLSAN